MTSFLKGNYNLSTAPSKTKRKRSGSKSLTEKLEEVALAKLGGSICFVMKKNTFMWNGDTSEEARR